MKKWISLCLALTLAGNTALFAADEVQKETLFSSFLAYAKPIAKAYAKPVAKVVFGTLAAVHYGREMKSSLRSLYHGYYLPTPKCMFFNTLSIALGGYVALQGIQELQQMYSSSKELPTDEQPSKKRKVAFADEGTE